MLITSDQKKRLDNWWNNGEQDRPIILCSCYKPDFAPLILKQNLDDYWNSPKAMVEREIQRIDNTLWFGEAVPYHYPEFGAAAMAIMMGADKEYIGTNSIWAIGNYTEPELIPEICLYTNADFYDLVWDTMKLSLDRSKNHHMLGMYCLGSPVDTLASLMGTENALLALATKPGKVKPILDDIFTCMARELERYINLIQQTGENYTTNWHGLYCSGKGIAIQEDSSCMLSKDMYETYCLPYVIALAEMQTHAFYHLDGPGALHHLDTILQIDAIKVVQWVPGAGHEDLSLWYDVIEAILNSGKSCFLYAKSKEIPVIVDAFGPDRLCFSVTDGTYENCCRLADRYQLEQLDTTKHYYAKSNELFNP
ncbi:MAG: hypothetical protein WBI39_06125 [Caldicoprobacterales bacterium]